METNKSKNPFLVQCKSCGGPIGYDIAAQTYRCAYCGQIAPPSEGEYNWKSLDKEDVQEIPRETEVCECVSCGAKIIYEDDEASQTCEFCGGNLIRRAFCDDDSFPDFIIPFTITPKEAKKRMTQFAETVKDEKVKKQITGNMSKLTGYYLPYRMVRGPLSGKADRDVGSISYKFKGYLDSAFINSSEQLDNDLLDAVEPFDMSEMKPFEYGYIAGQRVKLNNLPDAEIRQRVLDETGKAYKPYIDSVLQTDDALVTVDEGDFVNIPVLIPIYIIKKKRFTAVLNGQTGKIATTSREEVKQSKRWVLEPTLLTIIATAAAAWFSDMNIQLTLMTLVISALVFFTAFTQFRNNVKVKKFHQMEGERVSGENANPLPNTPVFYQNYEGRDVQVEMKFFSVMRIIKLALEVVIWVFLPVILAYFIGDGEVNMLYGAGWYCLGGGIAIIYYIAGIRRDIYNHPILFEITPDGSRIRWKDGEGKGMSLFSLFNIKGMIKGELGGTGRLIVIMMIGIFIGSTAAMIS